MHYVKSAGPYFTVFGPEKTLYFDIFYTVIWDLSKYKEVLVDMLEVVYIYFLIDVLKLFLNTRIIGVLE